jgi:2',3'-cyclic-nucleotide 2'-phosphodiesterase (5'-nucleotidase family)/endonuclease/exonuclease/phosphatase family metal-dependent hydrolase
LLPPAEDLAAGALFFESLEGMLVTVTSPVTTAPTAVFSSTSEIFAVVDNDADPNNEHPATGLTDRGTIIVEGGDPVLGFTNTNNGDFNPERIQIQDDTGVLAGFRLPDVDTGTRLQNVTGVMSYNFANYEVVATQAFGVAQASPLVKEDGALTGAADRLLVASYNAENLDANDPGDRFTTIADEIINTLNGPDIIALQEIQDNDGPGNAANSTVKAADDTLQMLVDAISAAGGPQYAFKDNPFIGDDTNGGEPGGNIRTAFLYRTDRVDFVECSLRTVGADGSAITDPNGNGNQQTDNTNPFFGSRPPLAATFEFNGQEVTVVNNHFSSKGGSGALLGSEQPPFDASEVQRAAQAQAVNNFVDGLLAQDANAKFIVAGDLNEFPFEEPIDIIKGIGSLANYNVPPTGPFDATGTFTPGGIEVLHDLLDTLPENEQYDYVFEGNAQTLDHFLVSGGLQQGAQFDVVRINAEFADQTSDHDPLLASFEIPPSTANFTLQLLHMSDGEAGLLADDTAPIMGALIDRFEDQYANTVVIAGGDNFIPGPFLNAGTDPSLNAIIGATAPARPDIAIYNAFGVDASVVGNHEFDLGSTVFADAIRPVGAWVGAQFPYLSANLDFSGDIALASRATAGGQEASSVKGRVAPSAIVTEGGEKIGILGATTQLLETISSPNGTEVKGFPTAGQPGDNEEFEDYDLLAAQLQPVINDLIAQGANKIILTTQLQQIVNEQLLATKLIGVDIIVAAGSNTRLGDADDEPAAFPGHEASFEGPYPIVTQGLDGKPTLIVNTDGEFTYLGRLVVEFNDAGEIIIDKLDDYVPVNGAYASTQEELEEAYGADIGQAFAEGSKGDKVRDIVDAVDAVIGAKDGNIVGYTDVYLEGERAFVRNQETNFGNLTADANAYAARQALGDIEFLTSLKNGGGIRAQIGAIDSETSDKIPPLANPDVGKPAGAVSQLDVENALRFDNKLMVFDTTAQGLLNILNHGMSLQLPAGGFPQIGGVRFSYDPDLPAAARIRDIALIDENDNVIAKLVDDGVVLPGAPATITVVTLSFTANGGDGYPVKQNAENFRFLLNDGTLSPPVDEALDFTAPANAPANALGEQQAFNEFMGEFHGTPETAFNEADTPAALDTRIQNVNLREDTVLDSPPILGDDADNQLIGSAGDDVIDGKEGDDHIDGLGGDDELFGGDDDDTINAGEGDDVVHGQHEDDVISGGAGDDELHGDEGGDKILGDADDDTIVGGKGNDTVEGGTGNDVVKAVLAPNKTDGVDSYNGGDGVDTLDFTGSISAIVLNLGAANFGSDTIRNFENVFGGDGNDVLTGTSLANELRGGAGADQLNGGSGNDVLVGGAGNDVMTGGGQSDQFVFNEIGGAKDVITDFAVVGTQQDTLVLAHGLFQNFTGDDPFDLIGSGFLRVQGLAGNRSEVQVDLDGGGNNWQALVELNGTITNGVLADHTVVLPQDPVV